MIPLEGGTVAGKVYLVGAGPGDPELLTLKGKRALEEAGCVVYDRLANPRLLEHAPAQAERIYVGKEANRHAMSQEEINALLVERGRLGQTVCRLKGGDPFVFGRGGEEAEALTEAGVPWEYVPGISSSVAAAGYAGIPVTHRGLASAFAVVTAHQDPGKEDSGVRWDHLAGVDTLVFLMGVERLPEIAAQLLAQGRAPETPAAVVNWATYPHQRTVTGTLADIAERCREAGLTAPSVTLVGEVAGLRSRLRWYDNRPLFGKRIAVTRPREQAGELARLIEAAGGEALLTPTIRIRRIPNPDLSGLLQPYDWVVFTSSNGVYSLTATLKENNRDIRLLGRAKIAAIGSETARAVEAIGIRVDFVPSQFVAEKIIEEFPEPVAGRRILIPRAREARELLPQIWRDQGATVDVVPVYETVADMDGLGELRRRLAAGEVDAVTFTASSTVRQLIRFVPESELQGIKVACIGPITAETARDAGLTVNAVAETFTARGLTDALQRLFGREPNE